MTATLTHPRNAPGTTGGVARLRVVLLARISLDRDTQWSTADQNHALDAWVESNDAEVVARFTEFGKSGFHKIPRPHLDEALALVRNGLADGLVVWKVDRFTRQGAVEAFRMVAHLKDGNGFLVATADDIDTRRDGSFDVLKLTFKAEAAKEESEAKAQRARNWHDGIARDARGHTGPVPFGYKRTAPYKLAVKRNEKDIIHQMAADALAGVSLRAIARQLQEDGVKSTTGKPWNVQGVKRILVNPATAGLRNVGGKRGKNDSYIGGEFVPGGWTPILDRETWEALCAMFADPSRRSHTPAQLASRTMLSGITVCGKCRGRRVESKFHKRGPRYQCAHCGNSITRKIADEKVTGAVLDILAGDGWRELRAQGKTHDKRAIAFLTRKLPVLREAWLADEMSDEDYREETAEIRARIADLESAPVVELPDVDDLHTAWMDGTLDVRDKRMVIQACATVTLEPITAGLGKGYNRVRVGRPTD